MAGRNRCEFVLTSGEHKGKKCNQGMGHNEVSETNAKATRHLYTPPKARPALNLSLIKDTVVKVTDPQVMAAHRRTHATTGEKSEERRFVDQVVQAAYDAWVESGKSADWAKSFGLLLNVPNDQVATFKDRVHTSAKAMAYKASFGTDTTDGELTTVALRVIDMPVTAPATNGQATADQPEPANA
jgi:hypothetical protein